MFKVHKVTLSDSILCSCGKTHKITKNPWLGTKTNSFLRTEQPMWTPAAEDPASDLNGSDGYGSGIWI